MRSLVFDLLLLTVVARFVALSTPFTRLDLPLDCSAAAKLINGHTNATAVRAARVANLRDMTFSRTRHRTSASGSFDHGRAKGTILVFKRDHDLAAIL
jgi:hypothetical protein